MILASCQPMATTSISATHGGNSWLAAVSVRAPSRLVKSDHFASVAMRSPALSFRDLFTLTQRDDDTGWGLLNKDLYDKNPIFANNIPRHN
jgi:hypothetical protein